MQTGNRFRAYPTPAQESILLQWIGHQRFIYNAKVSEDRYYRVFARKAVSLSGTAVPIDQEYARFIGENTPWLREVPSQILRNGAVRWKQSYTRFYAGLSRRPVFQRKDGRQSVWMTSELFSFRYDEKTDTEELVLGTKKFPVGVLSFTAHTPYSRPASLHVSVEAGKWYVSFSSDDGQAEFVCQRCGLTDNADQNASRVIAQRGIRLLLEGSIQKKRVRRCGIGKEKQPGPERSEVKASGEEHKTQRPKRLRASSAKEERPLVRSETPTTASA